MTVAVVVVLVVAAFLIGIILIVRRELQKPFGTINERRFDELRDKLRREVAETDFEIKRKMGRVRD